MSNRQIPNKSGLWSKFKPWVAGLLTFLFFSALSFYIISRQAPGGYKSFAPVLPFLLLAFVLSALAGLYIACTIKTPAHLHQMILDRAKESEKSMEQAKKAEQLIKESEVKYRTLVEQAMDGIFIADFSGKFSVVNPAGCRLSQYTEEELMTMRIHELVTPAEMAIKPLRLDEIAAGKTINSEGKMQRKDGEIIDVEISAKIIANDHFLAFVRDISKRKKAEKELIESRENLRRLTNYIENIREEERLNISREIHDELGQQLAVLKMDIAGLGNIIKDKNEVEFPGITSLLNAVSYMVETVRKISFRLRPGLLDDIGLVAALEWYCKDFSKRTGINASFTSTINDDIFPQELKIGLFRVFQESLSNAAGHPGAGEATVTLSRLHDKLILRISANGNAANAAVTDDNALAILGMKERIAMMGGTYTVHSGQASGTLVEVIVPFTNSKPVEITGSL